MYMLLRVVSAGVLFFLSFPPFGYWYLIFPSLFLFYYSLFLKNSFSNGFLFGAISYGGMLYGIQSIGYEAWIPLMILMGILYGFFGKLFSRLSYQKKTNYLQLLSVVAFFDILRAYIPFGGFPWGFSSTALLVPYLDGSEFLLTSLMFKTFGPTGFSLVLQSFILFVAVAAYENVNYKHALKIQSMFILFVVIVGTITNFNLGEAPQKSDLNLTIVQGNSPCPGAKNRCVNEREKIYQSHLNLTQNLQEEVDLVIWPESSTGFNNDPGVHSIVLDAISNESMRLNAYFLIGGDRPIGQSYFENYGVFISKATDSTKSSIVGQYLKQHPVPFGEYIPARKYLEWIPPLALVPRDMIRGVSEIVFYVDEIKVSSVISFEGAFQRYIRNSVLEGAEVVVVLTNQASYGESGMSDQFILMSTANALSNDRPLIHSAITGKSAIITNTGAILKISELFEATTLTDSVTPMNSLTLYTRFGNYLNYLILIASVLIFLKRFIRQSD